MKFFKSSSYDSYGFELSRFNCEMVAFLGSKIFNLAIYYPIFRAENTITNLIGRGAGNIFPYCPSSRDTKWRFGLALLLAYHCVDCFLLFPLDRVINQILTFRFGQYGKYQARPGIALAKS